MEKEGGEPTIRTSDCVPSVIWLIKHIHLCFTVDGDVQRQGTDLPASSWMEEWKLEWKKKQEEVNFLLSTLWAVHGGYGPTYRLLITLDPHAGADRPRSMWEIRFYSSQIIKWDEDLC